MEITTYMELMEAINQNEPIIELANSISVPNSLTLAKGQKITATNDDVFLSFLSGDGLGLTGDNEVSNLAIQTAPNYRAIYIDSNEEDLGTIRLNDLVVTGVVQLLTRGSNKTLEVQIDEVDVVAADARRFPERPMKYGVNVYQGALTVYNFNPAPDSKVTVTATNVSVGREKAPVIGSGIFISGFNDETGKVYVDQLTTNEVYSNGMIPTGQPNLITGGIFIVYGVETKEIISNGVVKTYGTNDMVLDNWGFIDRWIVKEDVISYGPSGIGFVNFGDVNYFKSEKEIITYGKGARGFNQYDGTIKDGYFETIKTVGDGSIGMQFSKPVGKITVGTEVSTAGSKGETLVKGKILNLQADAISVLEGGLIEELVLNGDLKTSGDHVVNYHVNGGEVQSIKRQGEIITTGKDSQDVLIENGGKSVEI